MAVGQFRTIEPIQNQERSKVMVRNIRNIFTVLAMAVFALVMATPASADADDPLFVNLTTDEGHRANMAFTFSKAVLERGHPVTIWLNDKGVLLASKVHGGKFADQQKTLAEMISKGVTVIVCPF
jgi:hypothetical protein